MASLYDLTQRIEHILKKYEKYDGDKKRKGGKTDDPFMEEYYELETEVDKLVDQATEIALEGNRTIVAQKNAEIRRMKQVLLAEGIAALQKKVKKGKGVSKALVEERQGKVREMMDKIYAVPDGLGMTGNRRPARHSAKGGKNDPIILDNNKTHPSSSAGYYDSTEQSQAFDREWQLAKAKQDERLERIGKGVDDLGEMARIQGEELERQAPVLDDVERGLDKATSQLKQNNVKLKALVTKMRSSRNFCVDVILIVILLAIGGYLYAAYGSKSL